MAERNLQVSASLDDAHEQEDTGVVTVDDLRVQVISAVAVSNRKWGGLRWAISGLSKGDLINSCTVQLYFPSVPSGNANCDIYFQDGIAAPLSFSATVNDIQDRARTVASVAWVEDGLGIGWETSPELKAVLQEVVDTYSPSALVIILKPRADANKVLSCRAWDLAPSQAAKLDVTFSRNIRSTDSIVAREETALASARAKGPTLLPVATVESIHAPEASSAREAARPPDGVARRQQEA